jgi:uncharacterized repeat protein (TIGR03803 family)
VLHAFPDAAGDGENPEGSLVMDKAGNLYGVTFGGGANGTGTVFKLAPDQTETVLYSFCNEQNCDDGGWPMAGVTLDKSGDLYGTTSTRGEYGNGTIFEITP